MSGGLNLSDSYSSNYVSNNKSDFRKAGDAFSVGSGNNITNSTTNNESNSRAIYAKWLSSMGNQNNQSSNQLTTSNRQGVNGWTPTATTPTNQNNSSSSSAQPDTREIDYNTNLPSDFDPAGKDAYGHNMWLYELTGNDHFLKTAQGMKS